MSGATAKKESMTLCVQLKRWSLPYPLRKPGIGLLAAVTSLGAALGLLFSLHGKSSDLCLDEFNIARMWRSR
jgi:hypothetical protein